MEISPLVVVVVVIVVSIVGALIGSLWRHVGHREQSGE